MTRMPRVAFYLPGSTRLLRGLDDSLVGGVEMQAVHLVRAVSQRLPVSLILYPPGPGDPRGPMPESLGPVDVHYLAHAPRPGQGLRGLRRHAKDLTAALSQCKADIVVERMATWDTLTTAVAARKAGCRFVFHWSGDHNGRLRDLKLPPPVLGPLGFALGRRMAHAEMVQTQSQAALAGRHDISEPQATDRERIHLFPDLLDTSLNWEDAAGPHNEILWLGAVKPEYKRPEMFLELAEHLPNRRFVMAGRMQGPAAWQEQLRSRMQTQPNLTYLGPVRRPDLPRLFARARVLVNTSSTEGFSSTFLEAAAAGVPVVSAYHDPNGILNQQGAGTCVNGDAGLADAIEHFFANDADWLAAREACRQVAAAHAPEAAGQRFARIMQAVLAAKRG